VTLHTPALAHLAVTFPVKPVLQGLLQVYPMLAGRLQLLHPTALETLTGRLLQTVFAWSKHTDAHTSISKTWLPTADETSAAHLHLPVMLLHTAAMLVLQR